MNPAISPPAQTSSATEPRPVKLVFRELRNYLAGQHVGATRDEALLDEVLKCLFCKLYIETRPATDRLSEADAAAQVRHLHAVFADVKRDFADLYPADTQLLLDPEQLHEVMRACAFPIVDADSDPIGDAFEVFAGAESRGRSGQFFTPRPVTDLLVAALKPDPGETVIDPACGAGGFLASVIRHWVARGIRPDRLAELTSHTLYGIDKDAYLVKLAKLHLSLLSGGHPAILLGDSLAMQQGSPSGPRPLGDALPANGFDVVVSNPPFGKHIVAATPRVLAGFELARQWRHRGDRMVPTDALRRRVPPQVLFVERCLSLVKPGGRLGMVVPESLLSNRSYRHVAQYLCERTDIRAVLGMPEALFKTSGKGGTHTKTCLVVAYKEEHKPTPRIFMAEAKWCGHDSRARAIPRNDLPAIADRLAAFHRHEDLAPSPLGFAVDKTRITNGILCPRYYDPQIDKTLASLAPTHHLLCVGKLVEAGTLALSTGDELGKLAYGTGDIPFIRTSDLSNWELKADPKHGVERSIYESLRSKQDVRANDILMVKDGTYLIGTCAIITEHDTEIIYQSHLYKIRVLDNPHDLDAHLLLAVLSCNIVQRQIRAKQFTQDIIDSLGTRVHELVLPIPRCEQKRRGIATMVAQAIRDRVRARTLARQARQAVTG